MVVLRTCGNDEHVEDDGLSRGHVGLDGQGEDGLYGQRQATLSLSNTGDLIRNIEARDKYTKYKYMNEQTNDWIDK